MRNQFCIAYMDAEFIPQPSELFRKKHTQPTVCSHHKEIKVFFDIGELFLEPFGLW